MDPVTRLIRKAFHLFEHALSSLLAISINRHCEHYITSYMSINKNLNIEDFDSPVHHFLGYFCVLSLRTRIDAVKADARRNPKTMMRPGRAKPCSHCMTHFHFQDRQVRESDLVLGRTLHQNSKEVSWHTRTCLGTCQS